MYFTASKIGGVDAGVTGPAVSSVLPASPSRAEPLTVSDEGFENFLHVPFALAVWRKKQI